MNSRVRMDRGDGWLRGALLSSAGALALAVGPALAQDQPDAATMEERDQDTAQAEQVQTQEDGALFAEDQQLTPGTPIGEATVGALHGSNVVNEQEEEIGSIRDIVLHRDDYSPHAIVDVGGWLGIGGTQIAVPLDELEIQTEDQVAYLTQSTREQIEEQAGDYDSDQFISHGDDEMPLAVYMSEDEFAAQQEEGDVAAAETDEEAVADDQATLEDDRETTTTTTTE